jgi:hypothetical protein
MLPNLCFASSALADTIRYDITPSAAYTVDNDTGIAKVTFNACLTTGRPAVISFNTVIESTKPGTVATYKVIKEPESSADSPPYAFNPATVTLVDGQQAIATTLTFTPDQLSSSPIVLRAKLDPEQGSGVGEGPGFMVRIKCVGAPLPAASVAAAQGPASCIQLNAIKVRAGKKARLVIRVTAGDGAQAGVLVRVRGAGINRKAMTNGQGKVVMNIKAKRKGVIYVQSNVCVGADRIVVLRPPAPQSGVGTGRPNVTG